jgi:hypothetical protein
VADLLTDDEARLAMGRKAYVASRAMTWANTASRYGEAFQLSGGPSRSPCLLWI